MLCQKLFVDDGRISALEILLLTISCVREQEEPTFWDLQSDSVVKWVPVLSYSLPEDGITNDGKLPQ